MDEKTRKICEDIVESKFQELIQILEQNLDFTRWGFTKAFVGVGQFSPIVIYESEACRVMFRWELRDIRDEGAKIDIRYGRLHAPNDETIIVWKGQRCYCWHDVRKTLFFLDGLSPSETASDPFLWPTVMEQFMRSTAKTSWTYWNQPEWMTTMHAVIWEHYGQRLFDLFDLRQPSLWDEYSRFVTEYQRLRQEFSLLGYPTPDKIC